MSALAVRKRVQALPPERRRDIAAALREGRATLDPRDAPIVAEIGRRPARWAQRWPLRIWIQPRSRRDRAEGALHIVLFVPSCASATYAVWSIGGWSHWAVLGLAVAEVMSIPTYVRVYQILRNAPAALAANQQASS